MGRNVKKKGEKCVFYPDICLQRAFGGVIVMLSV